MTVENPQKDLEVTAQGRARSSNLLSSPPAPATQYTTAAHAASEDEEGPTSSDDDHDKEVPPSQTCSRRPSYIPQNAAADTEIDKVNASLVKLKKISNSLTNSRIHNLIVITETEKKDKEEKLFLQELIRQLPCDHQTNITIGNLLNEVVNRIEKLETYRAPIYTYAYFQTFEEILVLLNTTEHYLPPYKRPSSRLGTTCRLEFVGVIAKELINQPVETWILERRVVGGLTKIVLPDPSKQMVYGIRQRCIFSPDHLRLEPSAEGLDRKKRIPVMMPADIEQTQLGRPARHVVFGYDANLYTPVLPDIEAEAEEAKQDDAHAKSPTHATITIKFLDLKAHPVPADIQEAFSKSQIQFGHLKEMHFSPVNDPDTPTKIQVPRAHAFELLQQMMEHYHRQNYLVQLSDESYANLLTDICRDIEKVVISMRNTFDGKKHSQRASNNVFSDVELVWDEERKKLFGLKKLIAKLLPELTLPTDEDPSSHEDSSFGEADSLWKSEYCAKDFLLRKQLHAISNKYGAVVSHIDDLRCEIPILLREQAENTALVCAQNVLLKRIQQLVSAKLAHDSPRKTAHEAFFQAWNQFQQTIIDLLTHLPPHLLPHLLPDGMAAEKAKEQDNGEEGLADFIMNDAFKSLSESNNVEEFLTFSLPENHPSLPQGKLDHIETAARNLFKAHEQRMPYLKDLLPYVINSLPRVENIATLIDSFPCNHLLQEDFFCVESAITEAFTAYTDQKEVLLQAINVYVSKDSFLCQPLRDLKPLLIQLMLGEETSLYLSGGKKIQEQLLTRIADKLRCHADLYSSHEVAARDASTANANCAMMEELLKSPVKKKRKIAKQGVHFAEGTKDPQPTVLYSPLPLRSSTSFILRAFSDYDTKGFSRSAANVSPQPIDAWEQGFLHLQKWLPGFVGAALALPILGYQEPQIHPELNHFQTKWFKKAAEILRMQLRANAKNQAELLAIDGSSGILENKTVLPPQYLQQFCELLGFQAMIRYKDEARGIVCASDEKMKRLNLPRLVLLMTGDPGKEYFQFLFKRNKVEKPECIYVRSDFDSGIPAVIAAIHAHILKHAELYSNYMEKYPDVRHASAAVALPRPRAPDPLSHAMYDPQKKERRPIQTQQFLLKKRSEIAEIERASCLPKK
jgi:hypothetical protein